MKPKLLFLNGASGAGKTTLASRLSSLQGVEWIHPDGLWDPETDQRESVFKAVALATNKFSAGIVVIDMQLRHEFLLDASAQYELSEIRQILLCCSTADREQRLLARGWDLATIGQMNHWADWLYQDAKVAGNVVLDTSDSSIDKVFDQITRLIRQWEWFNNL